MKHLHLFLLATAVLFSCEKQPSTPQNTGDPQENQEGGTEEGGTEVGGTEDEPTTVLIDFTALGYANQEAVKAYRRDGIEIEFSNAVWYDNYQSLRVYSSSTISLSASKEVTQVVFSFGEGDNDNPISASVGEFDTDTWTGTAGEVVFTIGGSSKHRRLTALEITLGGKAVQKPDQPDQPTPPAQAGEDVLTVGLLGIRSGGSYFDWTVTGPSSGVSYAGNTANYQDKAIQLRIKNDNSGIVSTTSGGKFRKVKIEWDPNTDAAGQARALEVYGHTMKYTSPEDLYQTGTQGTLLATLSYPSDTEFTAPGDYTFVGLKSQQGAVYLNSISITWE